MPLGDESAVSRELARSIDQSETTVTFRAALRSRLTARQTIETFVQFTRFIDTIT